MEPQLEGCGKCAPVQPRVGRRLASMEPQLEGCGKPRCGKEFLTKPALQWSRNLRVAESTGPTTAAAEDVVLQWSRNLRVAESARAGPPVLRDLCFNGAAT